MISGISKALAIVAGISLMAAGGQGKIHSRSAPMPLSDWSAPPSASSVKNPVPMTPASIQAGEAIFTQNCEACHGADGAGDGPTGAFLNPHPANLTTKAFWAQGEGAIFWKITNGHSPMPSFRNSLSATDRWNVINYLRHAFDKTK